METIVLSNEDRERLANLTAVKVFGLVKDYLSPKEETIKTNKSYGLNETAKIFNVTVHTIRNWYTDDKFCLLKKMKNVNKFSGISVKAEFERRNGKN